MKKGPHILVLRNDAIKEAAIKLIRRPDLPDNTRLTFDRDDQRTLDQNAMLHPLLRIIAGKLKWYGATLSEDEWKCVFLSGIREVKAIPGFEPGTVIMVGLSSSKLSKEDFSNLLELVLAYGAQHGVDLVDPRYEEVA